ncbi:MAG: hypothetical protein KME46_07460 [Brasilonema angustatum HA4187-MV1]|jgi:DNA-directed RNA polymerase specialized sigma24 family protein|nr:hypothetical protein [Brasilonema angustatum HA4187-MV1]
MDEDVLNYQLRQLVNEAQQHPPKSRERRKALNRLIKKIQDSGKIKRFTEWEDYPHFQDIYDEALGKTWMKICENIHNYNPQHPVMAWVNQIMNSRFFEILRQARRQQAIFCLDELYSLEVGFDNSAKGQLSRVRKELKEKEVSQTYENSENYLLREFIKDDPERILQITYIGNDINANLQRILLMRLDGEEWKYISEKLDHPIPRLSELYQRSLKKRKIIDYFRRYLQ